MANAKKISLNEWFYSAARKPFISIMASLIAMQLFAYSIHIYRSYRTAKQMSTILASFYELGILQSNRLLIEKISALSVAYDFSEVRLCEGSDLLYSSGLTGITNCESKPGYFSRVISVPLLDSKKKVAHFVYPYFKDYFSSLLFAVAPSILFFLIVHRLRLILTRIKNDLVDPLVHSIKFVDANEHEIQAGLNFNVTELNDLFESYRAKVLELKDAVAHQALLDKQATIGRITGQLSHDMRAPLSSIGRLLHLPLDTTLSNYNHTIRESLHRLNSMIDSLRHADIELLIEPKTCSIDFKIGLMGLESQAMSRNIRISFPEQDLKQKFMIDSLKFERSWINLASNAIDAAKSEVRIEVKIRESDLHLLVIDDGPGVAPEFLSRLFQRGMTYGKADGTGLGLAYVKRIMQGHGGDVRYYREADMTVFECFLPNTVIDGKNAAKDELLEAATITNDSPKKNSKKIVSLIFSSAALTRKVYEKLNPISNESYSFIEGFHESASIVLSNVDDILEKATDSGKRAISFNNSMTDDEIIRRSPIRLGLKG